MSNVIIEEDVYIEKAIIGEGAVIKKGCRIVDESGEIILIDIGAVVESTSKKKQDNDMLSDNTHKGGLANA